ncbi:F-box domain-containing protein [Mycena indigotica]|uniref:F-box domain-containing protein n=1 Tax=Mycena indigotica TaxID=2126181 RepID=A0A8H6SDM4_9AGAR|nr:F-box domain-containing protein [Mycena indigotica]KAF7297023.1 F-box domain-containing protein [Mycena indigotica]
MPSAAALLRGQIAVLDTQLRPLRQQIAVLDAERAQLAAQLDDIKYPILTLPDDVTLRIWSFVLNPWNPFYEYDAFAPAQPAIVVASVCRAWRALALSTTAPWATITASWEHTKPEDCTALVSLFLRRSGSTRPLDADFQFPGGPEHSWTVTDAFRVLQPAAGRLRRLRISFDEDEYDAVALDCNLLPAALPALEVLDLRFFSLAADTATSIFTPKLRTLCVASAEVALPLGLSLDNLVTLMLVRVRLPQTVDLLRETPRLETLHLAAGRPEEGGYGTVGGAGVVLSHLRELWCMHDKWDALLDRLTLPALETVTLRRLRDVGSVAFIALIQRSAPSALRSITLVDVTSAAGGPIMAALPPTVAALKLDSLSWDSHGIYLFCRAVRRRHCLRGLEHLHVVQPHTGRASVSSVGMWVDMVAARWGGWAPPESGGRRLGRGYGRRGRRRPEAPGGAPQVVRPGAHTGCRRGAPPRPVAQDAGAGAGR